LEAGSRGRVCVDVDSIAVFDVLEHSHCRVTCVVLHHFRVVLACANIISRMLEDAPLTIRALGGVLEEILADRRQILSAQTLLLHELVLSVGEATPLVLQEVLAVLALEPEPAQLRLDLLFPGGLSEGFVRSE